MGSVHCMLCILSVACDRSFTVKLYQVHKQYVQWGQTCKGGFVDIPCYSRFWKWKNLKGRHHRYHFYYPQSLLERSERTKVHGLKYLKWWTVDRSRINLSKPRSHLTVYDPRVITERTPQNSVTTLLSRWKTSLLLTLIMCAFVAFPNGWMNKQGTVLTVTHCEVKWQDKNLGTLL